MPGSQIRQEFMKIVRTKKRGAALVNALMEAVQPGRIQTKKAPQPKKK